MPLPLCRRHIEPCLHVLVYTVGSANRLSVQALHHMRSHGCVSFAVAHNLLLKSIVCALSMMCCKKWGLIRLSGTLSYGWCGGINWRDDAPVGRALSEEARLWLAKLLTHKANSSRLGVACFAFAPIAIARIGPQPSRAVGAVRGTAVWSGEARCALESSFSASHGWGCSHHHLSAICYLTARHVRPPFTHTARARGCSRRLQPLAPPPIQGTRKRPVGSGNPAG